MNGVYKGFNKMSTTMGYVISLNAKPSDDPKVDHDHIKREKSSMAVYSVSLDYQCSIMECVYQMLFGSPRVLKKSIMFNLAQGRTLLVDYLDDMHKHNGISWLTLARFVILCYTNGSDREALKISSSSSLVELYKIEVISLLLLRAYDVQEGVLLTKEKKGTDAPNIRCNSEQQLCDLKQIFGIL